MAKFGGAGLKQIFFQEALHGNGPSSSIHVSVINLLNNSLVGEGPSLNGGLRIPKINGCMERSHDRLLLVIQLDSVEEDVKYSMNHVLIYKFMGIRVYLPFLESWAR